MTQENLKLNNGYYSTSDLSLATTLSLWCPIEEIDHSRNPRKAFFIFRKTKELDKLVSEYHRNEIQISPQAYFNQLKVVKSRLYEERPSW